MRHISVWNSPKFSNILCDFPWLFQSFQNSLTFPWQENAFPFSRFSSFSSLSGNPVYSWKFDKNPATFVLSILHSILKTALYYLLTALFTLSVNQVCFGLQLICCYLIRSMILCIGLGTHKSTLNCYQWRFPHYGRLVSNLGKNHSILLNK